MINSCRNPKKPFGQRLVVVLQLVAREIDGGGAARAIAAIGRVLAQGKWRGGMRATGPVVALGVAV